MTKNPPREVPPARWRRSCRQSSARPIEELAVARVDGPGKVRAGASGLGSGRGCWAAAAEAAIVPIATIAAASVDLISPINTAWLAEQPDIICRAMGKVVKLESPTGQRRATKARRRRTKTALVLGGGGFTGGVYEIGALRAFDLLAVNRTVNEFDVYVGTSAGSFVASLLANGVTPEEMMRVLNKRLPSAIDDMDLGTILQPNYRGYAERAALLPLRLIGMLRSLAPRIGEISAMDLGVGLADNLPTGIYSGKGMRDYVEEVLSDPDRTNDFRLLERELYVTATDLDTCERTTLGEVDWADIPISKAVECSTALPIVYKPVDL